MRSRHFLACFLVMVVLAGQLTPFSQLTRVYALDGTLSPVTIGGGGGNWDVIPKADSLLRLSIIRQQKGVYANFGFKDNYPDNSGRSLILGGKGNNKTPNVGQFSNGSLGYVNSGGVVFYNDEWLGNNTRNIGSMIHSALMYGVDVYKGEGTSRLMTSREIQWTQWVDHALLQSANRGATSLPPVGEMTNKISFARVMDQTSDNMKAMANGMVCLGAFLNVERGSDFDLGDIWNFYVGKPSNFEYLLMLENLHYFSQNGVGLYIHQNQVTG